jgi:hypothetical protein
LLSNTHEAEDFTCKYCHSSNPDQRDEYGIEAEILIVRFERLEFGNIASKLQNKVTPSPSLTIGENEYLLSSIMEIIPILAITPPK